MNVTATDTHLARVLYDILRDQARSHPGRPIRYREVLERARSAHPLDSIVANAIPVSIGRRLEVIVQFVRKHGLPPLTCIAVNESGRPGEGYKTMFGTWEGDMHAVANHDWSKWREEWTRYAVAAITGPTPSARRSEEAARQLVLEQYRAGIIPKLTQEVKERLVHLLKDGLPFNDAWSQVQGPMMLNRQQ